jgi:4-oxalocrotonate tautomerase
METFISIDCLYEIGGIGHMPFVDVKLVGKLTEEQKAEIAERFTQILEEVARKPPEYVYVVFDEIDRGNWAMAGKLFSNK